MSGNDYQKGINTARRGGIPNPRAGALERAGYQQELDEQMRQQEQQRNRAQSYLSNSSTSDDGYSEIERKIAGVLAIIGLIVGGSAGYMYFGTSWLIALFALLGAFAGYIVPAVLKVAIVLAIGYVIVKVVLSFL